jgi:hypothetical protein
MLPSPLPAGVVSGLRTEPFGKEYSAALDVTQGPFFLLLPYGSESRQGSRTRPSFLRSRGAARASNVTIQVIVHFQARHWPQQLQQLPYLYLT